MYNGINVSPDALRRYGETANIIASELSSTGAFDLAGNLTAMTAALGLVGHDFLAMFAPAQANHAENYVDLAAAFAARARHAAANAAAYEDTDRAHAGALRAMETEIDAHTRNST